MLVLQSPVAADRGHWQWYCCLSQLRPDVLAAVLIQLNGAVTGLVLERLVLAIPLAVTVLNLGAEHALHLIELSSESCLRRLAA